MRFKKFYLSEKFNGYDFSCAMLELNFEAQQVIRQIQETIPVKYLYVDPEDHMQGLQDKLHITAKYGLHTDDPADIIRVVENVPPVNFELTGISRFEAEKYDVLIAQAKGEDLFVLNKILCNNLKYTDTFPEYKPHSTIAYLKKGSFEKLYPGMVVPALGIKGSSDRIHFTNTLGEEYYITLTGNKERKNHNEIY